MKNNKHANSRTYFLRRLFWTICLLVAATTVSAQNRTVTGVVLASDGEPIIGASVLEKGTSNGTITDLDGNFSLSVKSNATLLISYIGYISEEVKAETGRNLKITLKDDTQTLDEVVVVGFGTQKKVNLTGSVGIATAKDLQSRPVTNAVQALQGLVPGLKITTNTGELDKTMSISVRGTGTVGEDKSGNPFSKGDPLILIDGMEGDINTVNPQDIENISVLKDAAASSIYGSRAPFGVILVTTKNGQKGKTSINYNNSFRVSSPMNLPKSMDSYSFAVMLNTAVMNDEKGQFFPDELLQKMLDFQAGKLKHGLDPSASNPNVWEDYYRRGYANTDLYKETYRSSVFSQEHNLSINGGSERMTYYVSANYLGQGGMLKLGDDGLDRYNVTGKISATLTDWLKFNFSSRLTRNDVWRPTAFSGRFYNYYGRQNWPNTPMYDPNGYVFMDNARKLAYGGERKTRTDRKYYQAAFILEPIKNWVTNIEFNYSIMDENVKETTLPAYQRDPNGNLMDASKQNSSLYQNVKKENYMNLNAYTSYSHTFADAHNFKIMGGMQIEEMEQDFMSASKSGLIFADLPEFNLTSGLQGNGTLKDAAIEGYSNRWATAGFFGRLNYDYKGRYLAEVNMRYDGTSRFRRDSRWKLAPSFSAGWNIAQENFWEPFADVANMLKLRASYGELSNQNTNSWYPTYRTMTLKALDGKWLYNNARPNTAIIGGLVSTSLTWETIRSWDVGLDIGLFNNRLTGSFDYFIRYTKNMLGPVTELPATLGVNAPQTNNSDLQTRGWELQLSWRDRLNNGLGYGIAVNLSDQVTYIDSYPSNDATGSIDTFMKGKKYGLIWGFETIGIAKTQQEMDAHLASLPNGGQSTLGAANQWKAGDIMYRDVNNDGKISEGNRTWDDHGDLVILGDANPHYFFGVDLTADWKGFDVRAFFQGVLKHNFWPGGDSTTNDEKAGGYFWGVRGNKSEWHIRGFEQHMDYFRDTPTGLAGHELPVNIDSYFPRVITNSGGKNQRVQSRYMQNARYIRLKNFQVGYSLPTALVKKAGLSQCRFFVSGENLFTITPLFDVFDPETIEGGVGGNAYPLSRTWSFGLNLTF